MTHLREALSIRNLVCHGLIGITAQINPTDEKAHLSVELGGANRRLSWTELQAVFKWMSQARWLIRDLTTAVLELDPRRGDELLSVWDELDLSRFDAAPGSHLRGLSLEGQGAFPAQG